MTTVAVTGAATSELRPTTVLRTWWPLAASWLLMGVETPLIAAVVARLDDADRQLATIGGIVFPLALLIESPIIMMLAASTALCRDEDSYHRLRRFMTALAALLTALHAAITFTPLLDVVVLHVIGAPPELLEPSRLGMAIMLPWTWAIADRRFHQGLLIRFGRQHHVGIGTVVRLLGNAAPLAIALWVRTIPGAAAATAAWSTGVLVEMVYARWCARSVRRGPLAAAPPPAHALTAARIWRFYAPLALTPLLALASQPIGAAGMTRLPMAIESLAAWPALSGLTFLVRSVGVALTEVAVRHGDDAGGRRTLARFAWGFGAATSLILVMMAATPLASWWFGALSDLDPVLAQLATDALWWSAPLPLLGFLHALYQGFLVHAHRTRGITEGVAVHLVVMAMVLLALVRWGTLPGASAASAAMTAGAAANALWLRLRCAALPFAGAGSAPASRA
jgi:hypothetical protein